MAAGGVQGLVFNVAIYEDHSRLTVTRRDYAPLTGADRRLGSVRLGVGLADLAGMAPADSVQCVASSILIALHKAELTARSAPAPLEGVTGSSAHERLRLDIPG